MIGYKLRKLRENSGYTQQQVADSLNIDRSTYAYYESGKTKPDIDTIMRLSKVFNIHYTQLLGNETSESFADSRPSYINFKKKTFYNSSVYDLTKKEQQMIINFRMLSAEMQDKFSEQILASLNNNENK